MNNYNQAQVDLVAQALRDAAVTMTFSPSLDFYKLAMAVLAALNP